MFGLVLSIAAIIVIARMAETDRGEGLKWGAITFALCAVCSFIPIPFLNTLYVIGLSFALMTFTKKTFY